MKINVFTLNINNYCPEMMELTVPLIKKYANKIGAEFIEITERKFQDYHIHYEKLQIYDIGKDADWNIFFDGDVIVNNSMIDIRESNPNMVLLKDGYNVDIKFLTNKYFYKRKQGIASCFVATSKNCHNLWEPLDLTPKEISSKIIISKKDINDGLKADTPQDEYALSYNLAKYEYNYSGVPIDSMYHSYNANYNDNSKKLNEIKDKLKEWNL